jgi:hypothetical protein
MNKLVLHHTYVDGVAFDISDCRNHGIPIDVVQGSGAFADSLRFNGGSSRITVPTSPTLQDLRAIRARVVFYWDPATESNHRHNLIEGFISFVLGIGPDGHLFGGIVDAAGNWSGPSTAPGVVTSGDWHVADLIHDGANRCALFLDGTQVAYGDVPGPVRSVGDLGIAIGHWPDPPDFYTLEGYVAEVQLRKHDMSTEIADDLDPCCADFDGIAQLAGRLREDGWTRAALQESLRSLVTLATEATIRFRAAAGAEGDAAVRDALEAMAAFQRRDADGFRLAFARSAARVRRTLPSDEARDFIQRAELLVNELPIGTDEVRRLAEELCWTPGIPDDVEDLIDRHAEAGPPDTNPD